MGGSMKRLFVHEADSINLPLLRAHATESKINKLKKQKKIADNKSVSKQI